MAPKAKSGYGAGLWYGSPMTKLAQILTCKKSGEKQASEKVTNQDSPMDTAGRVREELIGTIVTGGTVDVTMNMLETDATHQDLFSNSGLNDGQAHSFELRWYDMTVDPTQSSTPAFSVEFEAIMFDIPDIDFPLDKAKVLTTKFTVVGDVVYKVAGVVV
jgi:hypothetical protein